MTYGLLVKPGVSFDLVAPAGFRILGALERTCRRLQFSLTITCGCEAHPPTDPHTLGEAYDVRTRDFSLDDKRRILRELMLDLVDDANPIDVVLPVGNGLATVQFYGQIEDIGGPNEHLHVQRRRSTTYAIADARTA